MAERGAGAICSVEEGIMNRLPLENDIQSVPGWSGGR